MKFKINIHLLQTLAVIAVTLIILLTPLYYLQWWVNCKFGNEKKPEPLVVTIVINGVTNYFPAVKDRVYILNFKKD